MLKSQYFILGMCLTCALSVKAQTSKTSVTTKLTEALKPFTEGVNTGKPQVDSLVESQDTLKLYINKGFGDVPQREETVRDLYASTVRVLGADLGSRKLRLYVGSTPIEDLVPNALRKDMKQRPAFHQQSGQPWVTNLDRPYTPTRGLAGRHIAMWQSHGKYYELGTGRWEWQRARLFETVEDKYTQSYVLPFLVPMLEHAGAIVALPRERDTNPYEVIVDNDGGLSKGKYAENQGREGWTQGQGAGFAYMRKVYKDFENPFQEGSYRQAQTVSNESQQSLVTWTPEIPADRKYAVYVAYRTVAGSTRDARYTVYHKDGVTHFSVNQQMGGGTWVYLGTFSFAKGQEARITLSNFSKDRHAIVTADAVRLGGGMGNIARRTPNDSIWPNTKQNKRTALPKARNEWQPALSQAPTCSGYPRYEEGARYWLQWAGYPDSIYSPSRGRNDYADDYMDRGMWVNYLAGRTLAAPNEEGLGVPIDLSFAFHSDAGTVYGDSIIGTLGIYDSHQYGGTYADHTSREANRDLCDLVLTSITHDVRQLFEPRWTRRGMWNSRYFEAWTPRVPAMLLELLSHENFADMRYGLDPRFRFHVSRAIYKGILRYLSNAYGYDYVVQPLPVSHFSATLAPGHKAELTWTAVADSLEPTAVADRFIVYTRVGDGDFDNGRLVKTNRLTVTVPEGKVVSFCVTAVNKGGESFPSEILSVGISPEDKGKPVLVVNGFDRLSAPDDFRSSDDELAGFISQRDGGVPYQSSITYVGAQKEFRRAIPWTDDDAGGFGDSRSDYERIEVAGNTFDYPALHGQAILNAGKSFCSISRKAVTTLSTEKYAAVDLVLGKNKQCKMGRMGARRGLEFKTFDASLKQALTDYCHSGGRVFVSGAYVGTDLWQNPLVKADSTDLTFASRVLKYRWLNDQADSKGTVVTVPSPLSNKDMTISYFNLPNEESYCVESPDAILPADDCAYTALRYADNMKSAAVVFGGNAVDHWRTVVWGFPFETIKSETQRNYLMKQVLDYLIK